MDLLRIYAGYQLDNPELYRITKHSMERRTSTPLRVVPLMFKSLRAIGLYTRPFENRKGQLWDLQSDAPMSTEFAISRFLVPHLQSDGWALYLDDDMLCLDDIARLFALADDRYAIMVVKHPEYVPEETTKLDNKLQTTYARKNWSSVVLWNCAHPAHKALTIEAVNTWPGRHLHQFCWLKDSEIGALPAEWNWLEGVSDWPETNDPACGLPSIIHFTRGGPWLDHCQNVQFANLWLRERDIIDAHTGMVRADPAKGSRKKFKA